MRRNQLKGIWNSGWWWVAWRHMKQSQWCKLSNKMMSLYLMTAVLPLTYSMETSPSWEVNWFSASQEIPHILRNPKVHYCINKCLPSVTILSKIDPVHAPHPTPSRSIVILSSHLRMGLPSGFFPSGFPTKILYTPLLSPLRAAVLPHLH